MRAVTVGNVHILPGSEFIGNLADLDHVGSVFFLDLVGPVFPLDLVGPVFPLLTRSLSFWRIKLITFTIQTG